MRRPIFTGSKSIIVKAFAMTQQTEMFVRLVELGEIPMAPNTNGLFTVDQVAVLASKRGCVTHQASDYGIDIQYRRKPSVKIMATDKGLWHPVKIFRACREAAGQPHYEIDYAKAKIKNPGNLNEVLIAEVIGADGVRPYLTKKSQHWDFGDESEWVQLEDPPPGHVKFVCPSDGKPGSWTWPFFCIMNQYIFGAGKSHEYRRAVRALNDAGLLKLNLGSRGGFGAATFEWLPAAYPAPIEAPKLDHADSEYLTDLLAVSR
jgi:hypothetical protein